MGQDGIIIATPNESRLQELTNERRKLKTKIEDLEDRDDANAKELADFWLKYAIIALEMAVEEEKTDGKKSSERKEECEGKLRLAKKLEALSKEEPRDQAAFEELVAEVIKVANSVLQEPDDLTPDRLKAL